MCRRMRGVQGGGCGGQGLRAGGRQGAAAAGNRMIGRTGQKEEAQGRFGDWMMRLLRLDLYAMLLLRLLLSEAAAGPQHSSNRRGGRPHLTHLCKLSLFCNEGTNHAVTCDFFLNVRFLKTVLGFARTISSSARTAAQAYDAAY